MKHWRLFSVSAVVLLCLACGVLGWRTLELLQSARFVSKIRQELYPQGGIVPEPAALDANLAALQRAQRSFPDDPELADLLFESLLYSAYFHPERAVEPLREALPLGRRILELDPGRNYKVASQLGWTLYFADLPNELTTWYDGMNAIDRGESGQLNYYAILAQAAQDDVEGALARMDREMRDLRFTSDMEAMAVTIYVSLNEIDRAGQHVQIAANHGVGSLDYLWGMGRYYLEQGNYEVAHSFMHEHYMAVSEMPDAAFDVALCRAAIYGQQDREMSALLDRAAESIRHENSRSGLEASLCAEMLDLTGDAEWYERLLQLHKLNPDDFFVQHALAAMACSALERSYGANKVNRSVRLPLPYEFAPPRELAQRTLDLARSPYQQQRAEMLLAYACVSSCNQAAPDPALLREAVLHLRRALGDPQTEGHVDYKDTANYVDFTADLHVRALRAASSDFDLAVNHAVVDFLNRKREQYADLLQSPQLVYKDIQRVEDHSSTT